MSKSDYSRTVDIAQPPRLEGRMRGDAVQAAIVDLIIERGMQAGDLLANEAELVQVLGISRNSVREAVKGLQALEILAIRPGSGTFVAEGSLAPLAELLSFRARLSIESDRSDAAELVQVREALEVELLPRALTRMRPDDLERIDAVVSAMEQRARDNEHFSDLDMEFHAALFAPVGNRLLSELLRSFWVVYQAIAESVDDDAVNPVETAAAHRAIYNSIAGGDADAAVDAMRSHFQSVRERIGPPR